MENMFITTGYFCFEALHRKAKWKKYVRELKVLFTFVKLVYTIN